MNVTMFGWRHCRSTSSSLSKSISSSTVLETIVFTAIRSGLFGEFPGLKS